VILGCDLSGKLIADRFGAGRSGADINRLSANGVGVAVDTSVER
jgi:hypothetical protein